MCDAIQGAFDFESQGEHLDRVRSRIGRSVLEFCRERLGETFHAQELRDRVAFDTGIVAPASADRVLRDLRQRGYVDYEVVSRRESKYRVLSVKEPPEDEPDE